MTVPKIEAYHHKRKALYEVTRELSAKRWVPSFRTKFKNEN
jgi:oligoribonuclease (3'-5' exoribonuclease)